MTDDVKDLLGRAAADSLRGIQLDLPTADDVARSESLSSAWDSGAASGQDAQLISLDAARRRARWPLGLVAALLAILAIGGGFLAVQSTDDPSPATPTTVPAGDPRQRLLDAIDASVAEVFEVHRSGVADDRLQAAGGGTGEIGTIWDGELSGTYVKGLDGPPWVTRIVDDMTTYYQTGPDRWVSTAEGEGVNPLVEFRQAAEQVCVVDRSGMIVVDLARQPDVQSAGPERCGSTAGIQYGVTLDTAGRLAVIGSGDSGDSVAMMWFEYTDVGRLERPDPSQVTERPNAVGTYVDPATGYWTVQEVDTAGSVGPTTTVVTEVGGP